MSDIVERINNPPEGGAITMNESSRQAIKYWRDLAIEAAGEIGELREALKTAKQMLEIGQFNTSGKMSASYTRALIIVSNVLSNQRNK